MDPTTCLREILSELASYPQRGEIIYKLRCLERWIADGGFLPAVNEFFSDEIGWSFHVPPKTPKPTSPKEKAAIIVCQMNDDDRETFTKDTWREGVSLMGYEDVDDILDEIENILEKKTV